MSDLTPICGVRKYRLKHTAKFSQPHTVSTLKLTPVTGVNGVRKIVPVSRREWKSIAEITAHDPVTVLDLCSTMCAPVSYPVASKVLTTPVDVLPPVSTVELGKERKQVMHCYMMKSCSNPATPTRELVTHPVTATYGESFTLPFEEFMSEGGTRERRYVEMDEDISFRGNLHRYNSSEDLRREINATLLSAPTV